MHQSQLFYQTLKHIPEDIQSVSHKLLVKAGFVDQLMAGVYTFLPLGLRVLRKVEGIVREIMRNDLNGQEVLMPALTPKENWETTGRWNTFAALFKLKGTGEKEYALGATHEEIVSPLAQKFILSYKDLPLYVFQIQTKFRNESRAKSGLLRTREFLMKDLYSFHSSEEDLDSYYTKVSEAYTNVFQKCGLSKATYKTLASGGSFSKYSHEYQTVTEFGEDIIHVCSKCAVGINDEIKSEISRCPECGAGEFEKKKAVEVGNIFKLGTKYSLPFGLQFKDNTGKNQPVIMGCYGLGISRIMAAVVEVNHDERGIVWPEALAPFQVHLLQLGEDPKIVREAKKLYDNFQKKGIDVLYDDRISANAGEKLVESDLIGIPWRVVVSERTLEKKGAEIKKRGDPKTHVISLGAVIKTIHG